MFSVSNADSDKEGTSEVEMKYQIRKKIQLLEESFSNPTLETNKTEFQANRLYSSGGLYRTDNLPYIVKGSIYIHPWLSKLFLETGIWNF